MLLAFVWTVWAKVATWVGSPAAGGDHVRAVEILGQATTGMTKVMLGGRTLVSAEGEIPQIRFFILVSS